MLACSTQLDDETTLEQLADVCGVFVMQKEDEILRTEAAAHAQRFNTDTDPHLAVLTVVGWLQRLIDTAFAARRCSSPVRSLAASCPSAVTP